MYSIHMSKAKYRNTYNVHMHLRKGLKRSIARKPTMINLKQNGHDDVHGKLAEEAQVQSQID